MALPSDLDRQVIEVLKEGRLDVLDDLQGGGPSVEVVYLDGGRRDAVSVWSVSVFAQSFHSSIGSLSQSDHERLLADLVRQGFLLPWPDTPAGGDRYFVLAASVA